MLPYDWSDEPVSHLLAIEPLGQILSKHDTWTHNGSSRAVHVTMYLQTLKISHQVCDTIQNGSLTSFTDPCASGPCLNGGVCNVTVNGFECTCRADFTGDRCENGKCISFLLRNKWHVNDLTNRDDYRTTFIVLQIAARLVLASMEEYVPLLLMVLNVRV